MTAWNGEIVGHRGAAGLAPENTLEAFEAAIAAGADRVEMDVRRTEDQQVVVFHDATLERFAGSGQGPDPPRPVHHHTLAELRRVDVGRALGRPGCLIPALDDVLTALRGRVRLNVEVKGSGADGLLTAQLTLAELRRHRALDGDDVLLSSFEVDVVRFAQAQAPRLHRSLIVDGRRRDDYVAIAGDLGCRALHPQHLLVNEHLVARCRAADLGMRPWTVNDEAVMRRLIALDVEGIVTDFPDRLRALAGR